MKASPHTANRAIAVISSMYGFRTKARACARGIEPFKGIEKYREEGRERYLTSIELQRLGEVMHEAETIGLPWDIDAGTRNRSTSQKRGRGNVK